ncbi:MAG: alpha/beta hydrolase [Proteobacteria bacterium]|nr:alpha/beta hydrolase [Pseudomonadota bacterium]
MPAQRGLGTGLLVSFALVALSACSPGRTIESWRVLEDIAAGAGPSTLKEVTPAPTRQAIAYRVEGRAYAGDLYRPGEAAKAALVLVPGAARAGRDDPRLVAFATTLARARFTVLVPDIENLRALYVGPEDVRSIADALRHLAARGDVPDPASVGLVAISYAAGPAILAALEPDLRDRVRFVLSIGGYYDIEAMVTFFTTGRFRETPEQPWRFMAPNAYGKWIFLRANARRLEDARDRWLLAAMARRKLDDLEAPLDDLAARLGPQGRSIHDLLANDDPDAVPALIAALPQAVRADMAALDLSRAELSRLGARLILLHGRDDAIIPFTESLALAAAVPEERVSLHVVDNLAHVDLGPGDLADALRLLSATYRMLALRDRGSR